MPTLRLNDTEIYYEVAGEGPPLLLLHGLGSSVRDWELQVPAFAPHFRVIAMDARGHGRSGKPPGPYSVPLFAADAAALLRALGSGPAHIVGISMGGMIAFQLAADAPDLVRSLVIVNSGPELVARTAGEHWQVFQRRLIVRLLGVRRMGAVLGKRLFPKPEHAELRRLIAERWAENDPRAYRAAMEALIGWSVADRIGGIACPVLVVAADADYTPLAHKEAYVRRMPHAELAIIADAHHAVPAEHPEEFNRTVLEFLLKQA